MSDTVSEPGARTELLPAEPRPLTDLVEYVPGSVVSRILKRGPAGAMTVFAFDAGEEVSEHTTPCDAFVLVLEGEVDLTIGGEVAHAHAGDLVLMPAGVPHSLRGASPFKILLIMMRAS